LHVENFGMTVIRSHKASRPQSIPAIRYQKFLQDSNNNYHAHFLHSSDFQLPECIGIRLILLIARNLMSRRCDAKLCTPLCVNEPNGNFGQST